MKQPAQVRKPTQEELGSLITYVAINRAFDPLDPTEEDGRIAEKKVARAHVAVFDGYPLEPG